VSFVTFSRGILERACSWLLASGQEHVTITA